MTVVEAKPGGEAKWEEIFLSSGKPLVKWKAEGLSEVHGWLDEGRDRNAWIDLDIHLTDQLSLEEIHRLRKAHPGFIHIRPVFEEKETGNDRIEVKHTSIEDRFKKFYEKQTGGGVPDEEMVKLFLELASTDDEEDAT